MTPIKVIIMHRSINHTSWSIND